MIAWTMPLPAVAIPAQIAAVPGSETPRSRVMNSGMNGIASWPPTRLAKGAIQIAYRLRRQLSFIELQGTMDGVGREGAGRAVSDCFAGRPGRPYTRVRRDHAGTDGYGTTGSRDGGVERRGGERRAGVAAPVALAGRPNRPRDLRRPALAPDGRA